MERSIELRPTWAFSSRRAIRRVRAAIDRDRWHQRKRALRHAEPGENETGWDAVVAMFAAQVV